MRIGYAAGVISVIVGLAMAQGCTSTAALESKQLAYNGKGPNPCVFGGVTEAAQQHCQQLRWGSEGLLMAINAKAVQGLPLADAEHPCQEHVARVEQALLQHPEFKSQRIYSCPEGGSDNCHVSLLVSDSGNQMFVLDNGAVLDSANYRSNVAHLDEFTAQLEEIYWIGSLPGNARQIASARRR